MTLANGNIVVIPAPTDAYKNEHRVAVHWQQTFTERQGNYIVLLVKNKSQDGAEVPMFIEEDWYTTAKLDKEATKIGTGEYELVINDRVQYGQKNANGDGRFAHRFVETSVASQVMAAAQKLLGEGLAVQAKQIQELGSAYIGDYLKTF
ncbi:hypothetical protein FRB96_004358 [Tulasnella sp. 330]|nr:hypothetical protein FRB96_004358 [Tulasnella sp. 330]KAG8867709.1 hypothetical protein FRB97_003125 [Tulasnella sp. 331]KAG8868714.1 hypothetical protein FRB98_003292 [Tulasnella sp. 332]